MKFLLILEKQNFVCNKQAGMNVRPDTTKSTDHDHTEIGVAVPLI